MASLGCCEGVTDANMESSKARPRVEPGGGAAITFDGVTVVGGAAIGGRLEPCPVNASNKL